MSIGEAFTCTAVEQALRQAAETEVAMALRQKPAAALAWERRMRRLSKSGVRMFRLGRTADTRPSPRQHQSKEYRGYRLASLIEVDSSDLDSRELTTLVRIAL